MFPDRGEYSMAVLKNANRLKSVAFPSCATLLLLLLLA